MADGGFETRYSSRIDAALTFAAQKHAGQRRKGSSTPYVVHPMHVAWLLQAYGHDEDTVIAGILHDVLEDTSCTRGELEGRFGKTVTDTVWEVTEPDKSLSWEERKRNAVARMHHMSPSGRAVTCADKAHNLHTIADALERGERHVFERLKRGPAQQLEYHRHALEALSVGCDHPILGELGGALERVEGLVR
ncbi:HD domain-containing protein [Myxococcota bacterium]